MDMKRQMEESTTIYWKLLRGILLVVMSSKGCTLFAIKNNENFKLINKIIMAITFVALSLYKAEIGGVLRCLQDN